MYDQRNIENLKKAEEQLETLEEWDIVPDLGGQEAYFEQEDYTVLVKMDSSEDGHYEVTWPTDTDRNAYKSIIEAKFGNYLKEIQYEEGADILQPLNLPYEGYWSEFGFDNLLHPEDSNSATAVTLTDDWPYEPRFSQVFSSLFDKTAPEDLSEEGKQKLGTDILSYLSA